MEITARQRHRVVGHLLTRFAKERSSPSSKPEQLWDLLCAAHIAGQFVFMLHIRTHLAMFSHAVHERQLGEVAGQLLRLALVPLGHLVRKLPAGNSGRANVSAFVAMDITPQWRGLIESALQATSVS
jgi:Protein of unknown function (DUF3703)